ncbi:MAG: peroxiredoxin [Bacteroidia bacterium]
MQLGDQMPSFSLKTDEGNEFNSESLNGKPSVVYFYPKNETKGCTSQACSFRDNFEEFTDAGVSVIGISSDSVKSHASFKKNHRLPFTLLADTQKVVRKKFGVKGNVLGLIPGRETFVFGANGKLVHKFESQINFNQHVNEALKALKDLD